MKRWPLYFVLSAAFSGCGQSSVPTDVATTPSEAAQPQSHLGVAHAMSDSSKTEAQEKVLSEPAVESPPPQQSSEPKLSYEETLAQAEEALKDRQGKAALDLLTQAIRQQPDQVDAYLKRAFLYSEAKLLVEAIADMNSVIELEPENPRHLNVRGYFQMVSQDYAKAISDFSDAIGLDLTYPQPYNNRGLCMIAQKAYHEAVMDFDNAIRARSDYADAYNNRGFALMQITQYDEAMVSLNKAVEINPKYVNALVNRGQCFIHLQQYENAVRDYSTLLELQPDNADHYLKRSEAWAHAGNEENSRNDRRYVTWLKEMDAINYRLLRNPQDAEGWSKRAELLISQNRTVDAEKAIQNALTITPDHAGALTAQALIAFNSGKFEQAIADCTKALLTDQKSVIYSLRADAYLEASKFDEAIADYAAARSFDTKVVEAYKRRAEQRRAEGKLELANADEHSAGELLRQMTEPVVRSAARAPEFMIEQVNFEEQNAEPTATEVSEESENPQPAATPDATVTE